MKKFEYRVIDHNSFDGKIQDEIITMGENGWEIITIQKSRPYLIGKGEFTRIFYKRENETTKTK